MSDFTTLHRSFAGGEITPELYGRFDLGKYQTGLADCRNFIVLPHGPITRRPGTRYVIETKYSDKRSCLIPFVFSDDVTYMLEFGDKYIRFHSNAETVVEAATNITGVSGSGTAVLTFTTGTAHGLSVGDWVIMAAVDNKSSRLEGRFLRVTAVTSTTYKLEDLDGVAVTASDLIQWTGGGTVARVYELESPYSAADVASIRYAQANDTITLTHPKYATRELSITSATNWSLSEVNFRSPLSNPGNVVAAADVDAGSEEPTLYTYLVTAATKDGDESGESPNGNFRPDRDTAANRLWNAGNRNSVSWTGVSEADFYNIYKAVGVGATELVSFGLIGRSTLATFTDDHITPDYSVTPPKESDPFNGANNYPAATCYFEQRRVFGGTSNRPQNMWFTRSGSDRNMSSSFPVRADDAIQFRIASRQLNAIKHIVAIDDLLVFTGAAVWRVWSKDSDALTPTTISVRPVEYIGANDVQPVVAGGFVLFCESRGGHVYEIAYSWEKSGYKADDTCILAPHMFDGYTIAGMTYAVAPNKVVWGVRSDGVLMGMTYLPQHEVRAWHRHDTAAGAFESCATVPEDTEDGVYFIVKRTLRGRTVRCIERLASTKASEQSDAFYVDCGGTYDGTAAKRVEGLWWLEGETVAILADGAVVDTVTVAGGRINLEYEASKVQIGLPMTSQAKTLPLVYETQDLGHGREKNVSSVNVRVRESSGLFAGPSYDDLREYAQRTVEPYGSPPALFSGVAQIDIDPEWNTEGQVCIQASDPLPMTVLSMSLNVAEGG